MPYTTAALNAAVDGVATLGTRVSFHSADPGTTGAAEISGTGRPATTWAAASGGSRVGSQVTASIPGATTVTHWGVFTAATGGTFLGGFPITPNEPFGSAGTIQLTPTLTANNLA